MGGRAADSLTVDTGADTISGAFASWINDGNEIACSTTADLSTHSNYFVRDSNGTTFKVAATLGGSAIDLTEGPLNCRAMWLPAWQPSNIVLDRILITMDQPQTYGSRVLGRGMLLDSGSLTLSRSWLTDVNNGADSQIVLFAGGGPYVIENNLFDGATENIMFGGTPRSIYTASGHGRFEGNIFSKTLRWRQEIDWAADTWYEIGSLRRPNSINMLAMNSGTSGGSEPTWPVSEDGTVVDNEITWIRLAAGNNFSQKNCWESKDGENIQIVRNGFYWQWKGAQDECIVLKASSVSSLEQESPALRTGVVDTSGTTVTWVSGDTLPYLYGDSGVAWDQMTIDGTEYDIDVAASLWTTKGGSDLTLELDSTPSCDPCDDVASSYGDTSDNHQLGALDNFFVGYNHFRHISSVSLVTPRSKVNRGHTSNIQFVGNLAEDVGVTWGGAGIKKFWNLTTLDDIDLLHNTVVPESLPDTRWMLYTGGGWEDEGTFQNNIAAGTTAGDATSPGFGVITKFFCDNVACTSAQWNQNVLAGGATTSYTIGTTYNLCPSAATCADPDYDTLFEDKANGNYHVVSTHAGYQGGTDGLSIGANPDLVPDIDVRVEAGDTSAILRIEPTAGVRDYPCVARVSTARDLRTLIADLNVATDAAHAGAYADAQSPAGAERVIPIGTRDALTPSTIYYYGVYCGGAQLDVPWHDEVHSFTTLAALSSTGTISVNGTPTAAGADDRVIQWGTSYDRATDAIQSPTLGTEADCAAGCTVSVTTNRGDLIYYRTLDRDSGDSVLESGPVQIAVVR